MQRIIQSLRHIERRTSVLVDVSLLVLQMREGGQSPEVTSAKVRLS